MSIAWPNHWPLIVSFAGSYDALVNPDTTTGKIVTPRVAALLDVMQVSEVDKVASPAPSSGRSMLATPSRPYGERRQEVHYRM